MTQKIYHPEAKHPPEYQQDLAPDASKGMNYGLEGPSIKTRMAHDIKKVVEMLSDFTNDELRQIPVLCEGTRLETKATYINLADPYLHEIQALGTEDAGPDDLYVAKKDVPYQLWNRLVGNHSLREVHRPR